MVAIEKLVKGMTPSMSALSPFAQTLAGHLAFLSRG